jgi:septum formation protein
MSPTSKLSKPLVLASGSRYRAALLDRLQLPFATVSPGTAETAGLGENCRDLASRLSAAKARDGARVFGQPAALVIGSDQVAELAGIALGKPGTRDNARRQLQSMRGQTIVFHTGLALLDVASGRLQVDVVPTTVTMRNYSDAAIEYYLDHEDALDCAGSAKSEGLGAALIHTMHSDDPTALVGLPLLRLIDMLHTEGVEVLA